MKQIVFVAPPFAGHFNPLLFLANAARGAGYQTEFVTGPRKLGIAERHGHEPVALRSIGPDSLEAIANTKEPVRGNPFRLLAQFRQNLRLLPAIGEELQARWSRTRPDLAVVDSVAPIAGLVAHRLGIPWITTIATPLALETHRGTPSYVGGWHPPSSLLGRARDAAGRRVVRTFKQTTRLLFRRDFRALGIEHLYRPDGTEVIYSPDCILGFGMSELEFDRDWPPAFRMIGPVVDAPDEPPAINLPTGRPLILVSHGTHLFWAKKTMVAEVLRLSESLSEAHFAVTFGDPKEAHYAASERVTVVPFIPYQGGNLDRFDVIVHHGGTGIAYGAIQSGIPCVAIPRDYDQFDYTARLVHRKLGLEAKSIPEAAPQIRRLLKREHWPAVAEFQRLSRVYHPAETFLEIVRRWL